jgi:selenocysteine lyase/cysteine desulfurase
MLLATKKSFFDIPSEVTFLNCANMSPLLKKVNQAGIDAINKRNHPWKIKVDDWFSPAEELRALFAAIIQADKEHIALIPSVSYGIAIAANNMLLKPDQRIIVLDQQFPSNI